jgi:hypothetical protein
LLIFSVGTGWESGRAGGKHINLSCIVFVQQAGSAKFVQQSGLDTVDCWPEYSSPVFIAADIWCGSAFYTGELSVYSVEPSDYGAEISAYYVEPSVYGEAHSVYYGEPSFCGVEPSVYGEANSVYYGEPSVCGVAPSVCGVEPSVYGVAPSV